MYSMLARQAIEKTSQEIKFKKSKQFIRNCTFRYCTCAVQCQNIHGAIKGILSHLTIFPEFPYILSYFEKESISDFQEL